MNKETAFTVDQKLSNEMVNEAENRSSNVTVVAANLIVGAVSLFDLCKVELIS